MGVVIGAFLGLAVLASAVADLARVALYVNPAVAEREKRQQFVRAWKPPLPLKSEAPDFTLPDRDGHPHRLSDLRNKPTYLAFYTDDPRSVTFAREFQKIRKHIGWNRMNAVAVVSFDRPALKEFLDKTHDGSLFLFEKKDSHPVRDRWGATDSPGGWVIDTDGKIQHSVPPVWGTGIPNDDLEAVLRALRPMLPPLHGQVLEFNFAG